MIDPASHQWKQCQSLIRSIQNDLETFSVFVGYYVECYRRYLVKALKVFWKDFNDQITDQESIPSHIYIFEKIYQLHQLIIHWIENPLIETIIDPSESTSFIKKLHSILYTIFIAEMPLIFSSLLFDLFTFSFEVFNTHPETSMTEKKSKFASCSICKFQKNNIENSCHCETLSEGFDPFLKNLKKLGVFHFLCDDIIKTVLYNSIETYISGLCKEKNFDISCLSLTCTWFENTVTNWIKRIYGDGSINDSKISIHLKSQRCLKADDNLDDENKSNDIDSQSNDKVEHIDINKIKNFITNTYIYSRMKQLFDIIIDFPYSEPSLLDLHECIKLEPFYQEKFTKSLKVALEVRLLHAGVPTSDIIEAYITSIKALKLLDPQGMILQIVCQPIRTYLRTRDDTVRCIITILTNDSLVNFENTRGEDIIKDNQNEDEVIYESWKSWKPQSMCASKLSSSVINSDIISMLIDIFDSKELFIQEYQRLLAQKLILNRDINLDFEIRNLEVLSLRFGESELHNCEVMLKDLRDSERINSRISSNEFDDLISNVKNQFPINGLILSEQFWPENLGFSQNEIKNFKLPKELEEMFSSYKEAFEAVKVNRTLIWHYQLGTVELEIEFKDKTQEFSVRPIQAAIIYLFQKQNQWKFSAISQELDVLPSILRRSIFYWKNIGVLREIENDCFEIVENSPSLHKPNPLSDQFNPISTDFDMFLDDEESMNETKNENNLQVFWNFIDNMLKNLHALPLERIYSILKMFNMQSPEIENLSIHELRHFLDGKVTEGKLICINGQYDLNTTVLEAE